MAANSRSRVNDYSASLGSSVEPFFPVKTLLIVSIHEAWVGDEVKIERCCDKVRRRCSEEKRNEIGFCLSMSDRILECCIVLLLPRWILRSENGLPDGLGFWQCGGFFGEGNRKTNWLKLKHGDGGDF
ncbi:hypothetical protein SLA2020_115390 [Shorea laevis]